MCWLVLPCRHARRCTSKSVWVRRVSGAHVSIGQPRVYVVERYEPVYYEPVYYERVYIPCDRRCQRERARRWEKHEREYYTDVREARREYEKDRREAEREYWKDARGAQREYEKDRREARLDRRW